MKKSNTLLKKITIVMLLVAFLGTTNNHSIPQPDNSNALIMPCIDDGEWILML